MTKKKGRTQVSEKAAPRIEWVSIDDLAVFPGNPKRHDVEQIAASMRRFGVVSPIVRDEKSGRIVAGHGRREALLHLRAEGEAPPRNVRVRGKQWLVPVLVGVRFESEEDVRAFLVADNRLSEIGGWDDAALSTMLGSIRGDLTGVGYSAKEIDLLVAKVTAAARAEEQEPPAPPVAPIDRDTFVRAGEVYALGPHRILCGDCRDPAAVRVLLGDRKIDVCVTSPPYAARREYDPSSGFKPIPADEYVTWFEAVQANVREFLAPTGSFFLNIKAHSEDGQRHLYVTDLLLAMVRRWGWRFVDELIWRNTRNGVPGIWHNRFKNGWEPVFHFCTVNKIKFRPLSVAHVSRDSFEYDPTISQSASGSGLLGSKGDVETHDGLARPSNVIEAAAEVGSGEHTAPYPVALPTFFVRAFSDPGDLVFDPFMGSGTTLVAAEREGRVAFGTEISPAYTQVVIERWQNLTGKKAERLDL